MINLNNKKEEIASVRITDAEDRSIIVAQNIGKKYLIFREQTRYVALRDVLASTFVRIFESIKQAFGSTERNYPSRRESFWALKNLNFEIKRGEVVGIIGRNGAGKSTLLKILSQITPPTTGVIKIRGTVGSLLEVGTGFHPELTGRENIFLNGAILGMKKKEVERKFNDIIEFADIDKFLDTPVKYYSSGMYVRLAFSVAVHMEPDVLIIDEVLAVGDADFQKKCLNKMKELTQNQGRTILFVSHNMLAVKELCLRSIWLSKGQIKMIGQTQDVLQAYAKETEIAAPALKQEITDSSARHRASSQTDNLVDSLVSTVSLSNITVSNLDSSGNIRSHDGLRFVLEYRNENETALKNTRLILTVKSTISQSTVLRLDSAVSGNSITLLPDHSLITCQTAPADLNEGEYIVDVDLFVDGSSINFVGAAIIFEIKTDPKVYGLKNLPDANICSRIIRYDFKNEK